MLAQPTLDLSLLADPSLLADDPSLLADDLTLCAPFWINDTYCSYIFTHLCSHLEPFSDWLGDSLLGQR